LQVQGYFTLIAQLSLVCCLFIHINKKIAKLSVAFYFEFIFSSKVKHSI
jgi:hypothetical protein